MNTARPALITGLAYSLPVVVWLLATLALQPATVIPRISLALTALLLAQAMTVVVFAPWCAEYADGWDSLLGMLLLLLVPLPLLALAWLTGSIDATRVGLTQIALFGLALLLLATTRGLLRLARGEIRRIAVAALQVLAATSVWAWREDWLNGWSGR